MLTMGVEEEFLLLDREGAVVPVAPALVPLMAHDRVKPELMTYQVETASDVCSDLRQLERQLVDLRRAVATAADRLGASLVASGAPPLDDPGLEFLTDAPRYRALLARFPDPTATSGTCACHVHVGVGDRDLAVRILARLRPWLPTLLALTTNSPLSNGQDTGWSSIRYARQLRWPTFVPPAPWHSTAAYDRAVSSLVRSGAALDVRSVYFLARLSPRYPTIEIRVADTCLEAADAVLLAGVARALVAALATDVRHRRPLLGPAVPALRADLLAVAMHGAPADLPPEGADELAPPALTFLVARLLRKILPELTSTGDADAVVTGLERLTHVRAGANRQRRIRAATTSPRQFVAAMAARTTSGGTGSSHAAPSADGMAG